MSWHHSRSEDRALLAAATIESTGFNMNDEMPDTLELIIKTRSGQRIRFEVWCDDEGNGPGALVPVEELKPVRTKSARVRTLHAPKPCRFCGADGIEAWDLCLKHFHELDLKRKAAGCDCFGTMLNRPCPPACSSHKV